MRSDEGRETLGGQLGEVKGQTGNNSTIFHWQFTAWILRFGGMFILDLEYHIEVILETLPEVI